jgi:hypothetical protein
MVPITGQTVHLTQPIYGFSGSCYRGVFADFYLRGLSACEPLSLAANNQILVPIIALYYPLLYSFFLVSARKGRGNG